MEMGTRCSQSRTEGAHECAMKVQQGLTEVGLGKN